MQTNLLFAGRIGSGKTDVSKAVAEALGSRWNSFGAALKKIAAARGLPITRDNLQSLGEQMVACEPDDLCNRVLADAGPAGQQLVIIDGLRHRHICDVLKALLAPQPVRVVYVEVCDEVRRERLRNRDALTDAELERLEKHSTEIQVATDIRGLADLIVDNSGPLEGTVAMIVRQVKALWCPPILG